MRNLVKLRNGPAVAVVVGALLTTVSACGGGDSGSTEAAAPAHIHASSQAPALPLRSGERFVELSVAQPYTPAPPNGGTDEYRCLVLDPKVAAPEYLTGVRFQAQNEPIAHHAITFVVAPEEAAAAREKDAKDPGEGYTCFGNDGLSSSTWVDTWTPSAQETLLDGDVGYRMEPGSLVILQVHYNLLATDGKPAGSDRSRVRLRVTKGTPDTTALDTLPMNGPIELPCAKNESGPLCERAASLADVKKRFGDQEGGKEEELLRECGHSAPEPGNTQTCTIQVPQPITIHATRGHMHLLGKSIKVELNPGTPAQQTLLDVPAFNFDDQALHELPAPVALKKGDTLRLTCTHDATLRQKLPQLKDTPPRYVIWGDGTTDEMCTGLLTVSAP
ncbi:monooxygenase [Pseudosporangium ferrugineum]|uniref:Copper type II ascorbate-dependent monooxygenase-like protein n=1 Tax=Pseudosporangium ferrugineum TaxID=439699 RepID=A0A2T0RRT3_9ACTN|nr:monooxygenase [Pseudosporangium ferrugineum]PRY23909.1 copper type II ascorbate-dependent monooxygenase-like protein [Pseudosporangium ferrugineum]